ncbi:CHAT domain-containing protein [Thauera sp. WH-1]|uniref:CHAT domain-containing protein n=1 Tax=Thauera sp. WH-1 TaxID=3398230 RepID=UPI0039FDDF1A
MRKDAVANVPTRFVDFALRAWCDGSYLQVIAHETPAGAMRRPEVVRVGPFERADWALPADASLREAASFGRRLAGLVFPDEIWRLLRESLAVVAAKPELGLRLRLCLDDSLIDFPWEYLYRPDIASDDTLSGFLLLDGRISLVREPASVLVRTPPDDRTRRALFVGTFFQDGSDRWGVKVEYDSLRAALRPLRRLIDFEFARADADAAVERGLQSGCDVFHYAGHVEVRAGRGVLIRCAHPALGAGGADGLQLMAADADPSGSREAQACTGNWAWSDQLAPRLVGAGVRLAVFNACNSGDWRFIRPFMHAGVPVVIGVQGVVSNIAALNFAEKLYRSLAVGLSIDEAMTYARLYVSDPQHSGYPGDWGRFMCYMPAETATLFPRSGRGALARSQRELRAERGETVDAVRLRANEIDGSGVSRMLSEIAQHTVLILGRFTAQRKAILDLLRRELSTPPRHYVPLLFDFDRPGDRDLIESIVRFASVSRFVIADVSSPNSIPAELQAIVPNFPSLPVVPIIDGRERAYPVMDNLLRRPSVLPVVHYEDAAHLRAILEECILSPAEGLYARLRPPSTDPATPAPSVSQ